MSEIKDLNPKDRVDRADRSIVRGLRLGFFAVAIGVVILVAYALAEAGWVAWTTVGIFLGVAVLLGLLVMLIAFLLS